MSSDDHFSGPPSPPPESERHSSGRHLAVSSDRAATLPREPAPSLPWEPEEDDDSSRAVAWRARLGEKALSAIGRPSGITRTGKRYDATGIWEVLEPLRHLADLADPLREMITDWQSQQETKKKGRGWFGERATKLIDGLLPAIVIAIAALAGGYVALHWR